MAYASFGPFFARKAAEDLTEKQYHAVRMNGDGELVVCGEGELALGVLTDDRDGTSTDSTRGEYATYQYRDIAKVVAGAEVDYGDIVMSDEGGKAVPAVAGSYAIGIAQEPGNDDQIISVQLHALFVTEEALGS